MQAFAKENGYSFTTRTYKRPSFRRINKVAVARSSSINQVLEERFRRVESGKIDIGK